jgi:hypothetical protein
MEEDELQLPSWDIGSPLWEVSSPSQMNNSTPVDWNTDVCLLDFELPNAS